MQFSAIAASRTVRLSGPVEPKVFRTPAGTFGTSPNDGFRPNTPQKLAGWRIEPPASLPMPSGPRPHATAAAAPPLDPADVRARSHGLRVGPNSRLSVGDFQPNSEVLVLPSTIAPAAFKRATTGASSSGTRSAYTYDPLVVRTPRVGMRSLIETGTPCSGPSTSAWARPRSAAAASARARSGITVQYAFT